MEAMRPRRLRKAPPVSLPLLLELSFAASSCPQESCGNTVLTQQDAEGQLQAQS